MADQSTRESVRVKPHGTSFGRENVDLLRQAMSYEAWQERFRAAVDEWVAQKGHSMKKLSEAIGRGPNYVSQMFKDGKEPRTQDVIDLAAVMNVSLNWIFLGVEMSGEDEKLLTLASKADENQKRSLLALLSSFEAPKPSEP